MNQEAVDIISTCCETVPRLWEMSDLYRDVDEGVGDLVVVGWNNRWCQFTRSRIWEHVGEVHIYSTSQRRLVFVNTRSVDFETSHDSGVFRGRHWARAYVQDFMADTVNQPGMMPVYRIPAQPDWHDVNDAVEDALEFLATHNGEVEFDFQGNRYKVPYGCDYAVMVAALMPERSRREISYGDPWTLGVGDDYSATYPTYGGISRSTAPQVPQSLIDQVTAMASASSNAPMMRQHAEQAMQRITDMTLQRTTDALFRPSPFLERLRGGSEMRSPIQFHLPDPPPGAVGQTLYWSPPGGDPLEFPTPGPLPGRQLRAVHLSEAASWPTMDFGIPGARIEFNAVGPTAREQELQRRLETIRECLTRTPSPLVFDTPETAQRMMYALAFDGQPVDESRVLLVSDAKLKYGTILDAAARPMRKFRLVEE